MRWKRAKVGFQMKDSAGRARACSYGFFLQPTIAAIRQDFSPQRATSIIQSRYTTACQHTETTASDERDEIAPAATINNRSDRNDQQRTLQQQANDCTYCDPGLE